MIAIYCRVSTREQAENGYNLQGQQDTLVEYVKRVYPERKYRLYIDKGISARTLERKDMQRMIKDIKKKEITEVIFFKLDRLTRSLKDWLELEELFIKYDIALGSNSENHSVKTANGRFMIHMFVSLAEMEDDKIGERVSNGIENGLLQGKFPISHTPFGYTRNEERELIEIPEEKQIFYQIQQFIIDGVSSVEIQHKINSLPYMIKNDKRISSRNLLTLISREIYHGKIMYQGEEYDLNIEPFLSEEEHKKLLEIYSMRTKNSKHEYLFKYLIRCECGTLMRVSCAYGKGGNVFLYYDCNKCNYRVNEKKVLKDVVPYIMKHIKTTNHQKNKRAFKNEMTSINNSIFKLEELYSSGEISSVYFNDMILSYSKRIDELESKNKRLQENLLENFDVLSFKEKSEILKDNINEIIYSFKYDKVIKIKVKK